MNRKGAGAIALLPIPLADWNNATAPGVRRGASDCITMRQASNIIEAVKFAKIVALPLVAHLTIHWSLTDVGDDPNGMLFAKVREGLHKWLYRQGIVFAGAWARERQCRGQSDVEHCHLLFHLPLNYCSGKRLAKVKEAILRLVELHGCGITHEAVIKLTFWRDPDAKYLIKGGGPKVWKQFGLRKEHRRLQGVIFGKRCGTTENIGPAARKRRSNKPKETPMNNSTETAAEEWEIAARIEQELRMRAPLDAAVAVMNGSAGKGEKDAVSLHSFADPN